MVDRYNCLVFVCSWLLNVCAIRKMGVSDDEPFLEPEDDEASASDDSCHANDDEEGIESIYDLENYDSDKGDQCVHEACVCVIV